MLLQSEVHKLVITANERVNQLTAECDSLTEQRDVNTQNCQKLQADLQAATRLQQQAVEKAESSHRCCVRQSLSSARFSIAANGKYLELSQAPQALS